MINLIKKTIFAVILFTLGIFLTIIYFLSSDISPTSWSFNHKFDTLQYTKNAITGKFCAIDNYLGIITVFFTTDGQLNQSSLFEIRSLTRPEWKHRSIISSSEYFNQTRYSFGFPTIKDSINNCYSFSIKLNVRGENKIILSKNYPRLQSVYVYPINILLSNFDLLLGFTFNKINYYSNSNHFFQTIIFFMLPLLLYLTNLSKKILKPISHINQNIYLFFAVFGMMIDIYILPKLIPTGLIFISILYLCSIIIEEKRTIHAYFYLIFLLSITVLLMMLFQIDKLVEKTYIWIFILLALRIVQTLFIQLNKIKILYYSKIFITLNKFNSKLIEKIQQVIVYINASNKRTILTFLASVLLSLCTVFTVSLYYKYIYFRDRQLKNPWVNILEPIYTYKSTKVILYGERFGEKKDERYRLMRNGKEIRTDYWDDNKIIFTIPLDWKPGEYSIWIERPIEWNTETIIEKTKPQTIRVLPVTGKITPDDDLYFKQMDTLRKETKEINGF